MLISHNKKGIGDEHFDITVSNLVLINSYIQQLKPKLVTPVAVGVAEGILVHDWP